MGMPVWKPNPDRLEPTWVGQTKQWEWSTNREAETGMDKVGPVQDPEQSPRLQNLTFPVCSSNLHLKTKDFHLVSGVSEMLQRPTRMSPPLPIPVFG